MKTSKSVIKTEEQGFNEMPARAEIEKLLAEHLNERAYRFVDVDKEYWINANDTMVIEIDGNEVWRFGASRVLDNMVGLATLVRKMKVDEFDTIPMRGEKMVIRFWWD